MIHFRFWEALCRVQEKCCSPSTLRKQKWVGGEKERELRMAAYQFILLCFYKMLFRKLKEPTFLKTSVIFWGKEWSHSVARRPEFKSRLCHFVPVSSSVKPDNIPYCLHWRALVCSEQHWAGSLDHNSGSCSDRNSLGKLVSSLSSLSVSQSGRGCDLTSYTDFCEDRDNRRCEDFA